MPKDETATCHRCGQAWPRHPCLEVPCPVCQAKVGSRCKRPSEWSGSFVDFHVEREQAALDAGILQPCPASKQETAKTPAKVKATKPVNLSPHPTLF